MCWMRPKRGGFQFYLELLPRLLVSEYKVFVFVFVFVFLLGKCIVGAELWRSSSH